MSEPRAGRAARAWTTGRQTEPRVRSTFNNAGLRPTLHPVFGSTFLRGISRSLSKRGVPRLRTRHTAHPPIGSELPRPFSCQPRRKNGAKTRTLAHVSLLLFTPRSRTPFRRDEKGRSVICRSKITIAKEKPYLKESQPGEHEEFPLNNGGESICT